jgi:hypothetical protein
MDIQVSTDKIAIEYRDVPIGFFYGWHGRMIFQHIYRVKRTEYKKIYVYQLHIRRERGEYLHVFYRNFRETDGGLYTLRVETRPEHLERFGGILEEFRKISSGIDFVSCDVAYDVPVALGNIFIAPTDARRKLRLHKGSRYFAQPHQRKQNAYCRVYDKALELWQRHGIEIEDDLTRIEMVYKPERRIPLLEMKRHPPKQNEHYFASVIEDWSIYTAK